MSYLENGSGLADFAETEFDDDETVMTEFDDDDDESYAEFDDDDDESYAEFDDDDDESYAEFDDDDDEAEGYGEANPEFIGGLLTGGISTAIKGISKLVGRRGRSRRSIRRYRPSNYLRHRTASGRVRIPGMSRLAGILRTKRGQYRFKLPPNVATKADVKKIQGAMAAGFKRNGRAIKRNASGVRKNLASARKLNADFKVLDKKHSAVSARQNKVLSKLNKRILSLKKSQDAAQQQAQTQALLSMFMQPELESITLDDGTTQNITNTEWESNLMPLFFAMSGNQSGGSGFNNPMMMFAMMQMMD